ncbi:MAG: iron ABC transporter permease, partial [Myxococcales bacterium]
MSTVPERRTPVALLAAGTLVALFALVPLGFVITYTVITGPSEAWHLLWRPRIGELLFNTARLLVAVVILSVLIGIGAAWLVERSTLRWRGLWHTLLVAPLAVPAFVNSYGWVSLTTSVQNYWGATLIVTLSYYPLVYLPTVATLRGLDPALEETALSLGHSRWRAFTSVVLPQLRPAVLGGALLVGLHLLAEYGAVQMLRFPTFTTAIYDQYKSAFNAPAANMIAGVLVLGCVLLLTVELRLRGQRRYVRLGQGTARLAERLPLGRASAPVHLALAGLVALALGVPTYSLVHWLRVGSSTQFPVDDLVAATVSTLGLAAAAAVVTVIFALPVAW